MPGMPAPIEVFCIYSPEDEPLYLSLEGHLAQMCNQGRITLWHARKVMPGATYQREIAAHLERASVILLLVSASFMATEYVLMEQALKRGQAKQAYVVPILLKAIYWQGAPFAHLEVLPSNKKPITSWNLRDEAFLDVVVGLNHVFDKLPLLLGVSSPATDVSASHSSVDHSQMVQAGVDSQPEDHMAEKPFDVFLCHHMPDKPAVKLIGEQLKQRGIRPWLDEWELRPGLPWQTALEEQIESIKAAAVFVGQSRFGPWQEQEANAFLRQFVSRRCPVIPVLLPDVPGAGKPDLPVFLDGMTWVDFRVTEPDPLDRLIWGITGKRPEH